METNPYQTSDSPAMPESGSNLQIGLAMSNGWQSFTKNLGLALGIVVIAIVLMSVIAIINYVLNLSITTALTAFAFASENQVAALGISTISNQIISIPFSLINTLLGAGLVFFFILLADKTRNISNATPSIENLFAGFKKILLLIKIYFIQLGLNLLYLVPALIIIGVFVGMHGPDTVFTGIVNEMAINPLGLYARLVPVFLLSILLSIYFGVRFSFMQFIAMDLDNMGAIACLKRSWQITAGMPTFFKIIGFSIISFFAFMISTMLCVLPIIGTMGWFASSTADIYRQLSLRTPIAT